mgnify:CR=1 FL=1
MMTEDQIKELLKSGMTSDEIAQAFTDNLNNAIDAIAEEERIEATKREVERKREEQRADAKTFIEAMRNYMYKWHPDTKTELDEDLSDEYIDVFIDSFSALNDIMNSVKSSADELLDQFLGAI